VNIPEVALAGKPREDRRGCRGWNHYSVWAARDGQCGPEGARRFQKIRREFSGWEIWSV